MKRTKKVLSIIVLIITMAVSASLFSACNAKVSDSVFAFGTVSEISLKGKKAKNTIKSIDSLFTRLDVLFDAENEKSDVYKINHADKDVVLQISEKIKSINIDGIIGAEYVSRFVSEHAGSIFNQSGMTEKPDVVSAKILEGRVALFIDGTPVVITYPYVLLESFQDGYDYYVQNKRATMLRIIRIIGAFLAVLLPGLYVAFQEYHYQLMPLKFLISLLNSVSGIPFTPPMEMLFVLALFEVLNQASIRMPRYVGTALSIVGAIVLGETAVNAGLLSSPTVLVIAISAIGINCVPDLVDAFSILRLAGLITGSILGLFGIVVFSMGLIAYLCGLDSFGSPYLAPFAPMITADFKDAVAKENLLSFEKRPYSVPTKNRRRMRRDR